MKFSKEQLRAIAVKFKKGFISKRKQAQTYLGKPLVDREIFEKRYGRMRDRYNFTPDWYNTFAEINEIPNPEISYKTLRKAGLPINWSKKQKAAHEVYRRSRLAGRLAQDNPGLSIPLGAYGTLYGGALGYLYGTKSGKRLRARIKAQEKKREKQAYKKHGRAINERARKIVRGEI